MKLWKPIVLFVTTIALLVVMPLWHSHPRVSTPATELTASPQSTTSTTVTPVVTVPPTTTTVVAPAPDPVPTTTAPPAAPTDLTSAWAKVASCESGSSNFDVQGYPAYPNSLGINAQNWAQFGGTSDVSPAAQIAVAERFRAYYGIPIPDQNGCAAW